MSRMSTDFSISSVLRILHVSRTSFYAYRNHKTTRSELRRIDTTEKVIAIYNESKGIYGSPKITKEINKNQEDKVSQKFIYEIMRRLGIKAKYVHHTTITTHSEDFSSKLKNLLKRDFNPNRPDACWCTDITYIWTYDDGFVYLTSIMDLFSRKIIAWSLTRTMECEEVLECIRIAKSRRDIENPLIIHSDRGVQYTSELYNNLTGGMMRSYSRKANPWDNACIESWHALIKRECLNNHDIQDYYHAKSLVFEYIEGFYNTVRIHSHCGYLSPNQYEQEYSHNKLAFANADDELMRAVSY